MVKSIQINVTGRVQGVGFRWATKRVAEKLGVTGYVTNLMDGHVKIVAQASSRTLKRFTAAVKASPTPYGRVTHIEIKAITGTNYSFFDVK